MPKVTYIDYKGNSKTIEVDNGLTVMEGAVQMIFQVSTLIVGALWPALPAMFMSKING